MIVHRHPKTMELFIMRLELQGALCPMSQCQCLTLTCKSQHLMLVTTPDVSHIPIMLVPFQQSQSQPLMLVINLDVNDNPLCQSQICMLVATPEVSYNPGCKSQPLMLVTTPHVSPIPIMLVSFPPCQSQPLMLVTTLDVSHNSLCQSQPLILVTTPDVSHNP